MKRKLNVFTIGVILVGAVFYLYPNKSIEDRLWMYKYNPNVDGYYFTDGEGYYFSSEENSLYIYSDIDKKFDTEKCVMSKDLGPSRSLGRYTINDDNVRVTRTSPDDRQDEKEYDFSIKYKHDTILWGCQFSQIQLTLNKDKSKEVYTLYSPK